MSRSVLKTVRVIAIAAIFGLAGLYASLYLRGDPAGDEAEPSLPQSTVEDPTTPVLVSSLPDFSLSDLDGNPRSITEWAGQPMLINFWATWCAPCLREMPLLQKLQDQRGDQLQVIGIAVDRMPAVQSFLAEAGVSYPVLVGQQDAMDAAELFGPEFLALPFSIFIGADGAVLGLRPGELDPDELRELIDTLDAVAAGQISIARARSLIGEG
jgi:thiol-disulfide isomerase/thioredoxin